MSITALQSTKKALRRSMAKTLQDLTQSEVQSQSEAIVAKVVALPAFKRAKTISCYLSMPTAEVQTGALVANILADSGKKLFVPSLTSKEGQMDFVRLYDKEDLRTLPAGLWGIPEPTAEWKSEKRQSVSDASCEHLDMIIMPGVAFDSSLSRLGHGKGYYDHFISSYVDAAKRPRPLLVALSLQQQLVEAGQVPMTDHDEKVDVIATPKDIITRENLVIE
ncbi:5-formyltetrahydrofolate cyclo-ligase [Boletus edulis]|uniref:5-formyltetrahydrofolate cyclo-ligase n=1 Tax=Boletus edulis BED1 TaxID=1328754 RepID=A0AAD4BRR4_BOLED|nr:5-formyltetrahydrofolate cyclo-ligase [Boletus edulis]KAF8437979.1 5-formyltetrahydrofolate cyclo-ligase [Boletus edulis BED1]